MQAFHGVSIERVVSCLITLALLLAGGCKREETAASRSESAPSSRAESHSSASARDWYTISVEADPGWEEAEIERIAAGELGLCREVLEKRLGVAIGPRVLDVRFVHDEAALDRLAKDTPPPTGFLRLYDSALFRWSGSLLVFTRAAEVTDRTYMMSLALLQLHSGIGPIRLSDSVARWMSGLVINRLRDEPLWDRGRVWERFTAAFQRPHEVPAAKDVCAWASRPYPFANDLEDRDPVTGTSVEGLDWRYTDMVPVDSVRSWSWFLVYFLATFDVADDGRVRFGGPAKHDWLLRRLVAKTEPGSPTACELLGGTKGLAEEYSAYAQFVLRKMSLGEMRSGVLLSAEEAPPGGARKNAVSAGDLLKPK